MENRNGLEDLAGEQIDGAQHCQADEGPFADLVIAVLFCPEHAEAAVEQAEAGDDDELCSFAGDCGEDGVVDIRVCSFLDELAQIPYAACCEQAFDDDIWQVAA